MVSSSKGSTQRIEGHSLLQNGGSSGNAMILVIFLFDIRSGAGTCSKQPTIFGNSRQIVSKKNRLEWHEDEVVALIIIELACSPVAHLSYPQFHFVFCSSCASIASIASRVFRDLLLTSRTSSN